MVCFVLHIIYLGLALNNLMSQYTMAHSIEKQQQEEPLSTTQWLMSSLETRMNAHLDLTTVMLDNLDNVLDQKAKLILNKDSTEESHTRYDSIASSSNDAILLNFEDSNMQSIIDLFSALTDINFIYTNVSLDFPVTLVAPNKVLLRDFEGIILKILDTNGIAANEIGNNVYLSYKTDANTGAKIGESDVDGHMYVTKIFHIDHSSPTDIAKVVEPLLSMTSNIGITDEYIVVTDTTSILARVTKLIEAIDLAGMEFAIKEYKIKEFDPGMIHTLQDMALKILAPFIAGKVFVMVPYERKNQIYIIASKLLVQKAYEVLESLDCPEEILANNSKLYITPLHKIPKAHIYRVCYQNPKAVLSILKEWSSIINAGSIKSELLEALESLNLLEDSNLLTYYSTSKVAQLIDTMLRTIDVPCGLVGIDILILDTLVSKQYSFGVDWHGSSGKNIDPVKNISELGLDLVSGFSFTSIGNVLKIGNIIFDDISTFIQAVYDDTGSYIAWNPNITTSDQHDADLFFGSQIPVKSGSVTRSPDGNSTTYNEHTVLDVGVRLKIKASIGHVNINDDNSKGDIVLDIHQEITDITQTVGHGVRVQDYPTTTKYLVDTSVRVPDQAYLLLSGLSRDLSKSTSSGLPCGNIFCRMFCFISRIFGGHTLEFNEKRCWMVFIKPHIINSAEEILQSYMNKTNALDNDEMLAPQIKQKLIDNKLL